MKNPVSIARQSVFAVGIVAFTLMAGAGVAQAADAIPYGNVGTPNPILYTFTATATGDIMAYYAGSSAGYDSQIGLLVNGVGTGTVGLDNQSALPVGTSLNLGHANAGDTLTFFLKNITLGLNAYSDASLNAPYDIAGEVANGHNHIYSTAYTRTGDVGGSLPILLTANIPVGTYVAFEDRRFNGLAAGAFGSGINNSDFDYNDETFIFTDVSTVTRNAPDGGSSLLLLGMGFAGLGMLRRRLAV